MTLLIMSLCIFGCAEIHTEAPVIVTGIEINYQKYHKGYYRITLSCSHNDNLLLFTDKRYNIGDTIQ